MVAVSIDNFFLSVYVKNVPWWNVVSKFKLNVNEISVVNLPLGFIEKGQISMILFFYKKKAKKIIYLQIKKVIQWMCRSKMASDQVWIYSKHPKGEDPGKSLIHQ